MNTNHTDQHTTSVSPCDRVVTDSIVETKITTNDTNRFGYYTANGTDRSLAYGQAPDGDWVLWIETNADPILIWDGMDYDDWLAACYDMGDDRPDLDEDGEGKHGLTLWPGDFATVGDERRIAEGYVRIAAAAGMVPGGYPLPRNPLPRR